MAWENKVPHDESSWDISALLVYADVAYLAMHLDKRSFGDLNVVGDSRELHADSFVRVSKVAQVDVHDSIQKSQR
jgi:hypothetical protein